MPRPVSICTLLMAAIFSVTPCTSTPRTLSPLAETRGGPRGSRRNPCWRPSPQVHAVDQGGDGDQRGGGQNDAEQRQKAAQLVLAQRIEGDPGGLPERAETMEVRAKETVTRDLKVRPVGVKERHGAVGRRKG